VRIRRIAIDGYGRFSHCTFKVASGLQVLFGPNEQGKSTLRGFIGDMLYGQKRSAVTRLYEDSNELRCPWANPEVYGGRLFYDLDDGREIEIYRRFDKKNEVVVVYDRTQARDITAEFEQFRNREPMFAQTHLGLSKEVFLNTATLSHVTLEDLGDADALGQIRERLLALADTGDETSSAEAALKRLKARIDTIGPPAARTRPLPQARARLAELAREQEQVAALRQELAKVEQRRRDCLDEIENLRRQKAALEQGLMAVEHIERAERLREAERLAACIDEATQQCFALSAVRDFPLDQTPEIHRAATLVGTARVQLDRTRAERGQLEEQIAEELERLGEAASPGDQDIPEAYDQRLADIGSKIQRLRDRLDDIASSRAGSESRLRAAEEEFATLPDFSLLADDPVTWINELASSFRIALRSREDERGKRDALREQIRRRREGMNALEVVFSKCEDFPTRAREYEVNARMREEQAALLRTTVEALYTTAEEYGDRISVFGWFAVLTGAFLLGLLIVALTTGNRGVYIPAAAAAVAATAFVASMVHARAKTRRALKQLEEKQAEIQEIWTTDETQRKTIDHMIVDSGCQTLRELAGKYDQYRQARVELASLEEADREQETRSTEAEQRAPRLFETFRETFRAMGEELQGEEEVEAAAGRATARYQVYRDAKRRIAENRDQIKRYDADAVGLNEELTVALEEERGLALEARRLMRENGYPEESKHDSALIALRSYRIRHAELHKKRGRIDVLKEKLVEFDEKVQAEEQDLRRLSEALAKQLAAGKCASVEQWRERAEQAREYRDIRERIAGLQERLRAELRGKDLRELRAAVEGEGPLPLAPSRPIEALRRELETVSDDLDARMKEEHGLALTLAERTAGARSLNEIEEERAVIEERVRLLELEMEAAGYAMTLIEEIARDKHARIAPRLAAAADGFLKEITGGAYDELLISRDLRVSVRIPQLQRMSDNPENVLSKGTVDQIYLALRLAMVQSLSENGESIPMLLDDPFANYDDQRLGHTLSLLHRLAAKSQVLLFTCRENVVRAAQAMDVSVLSL